MKRLSPFSAGRHRPFIILFLLALIGTGLVGASMATPVLKFEMEPAKRIYSSREGLVVKFTFTANARTKLCLEKDFLTQMTVSVSRPGVGKLPLAPLVVTDHKEIFQQRTKIRWLKAGEKLTLRANLRRFRFANGDPWAPGEYSVNAVFNLCEQTPEEAVNPLGKEIPVPARQPAWLMIMN
jgi:hypothetical protein